MLVRSGGGKKFREVDRGASCLSLRKREQKKKIS